MRTFTLQRGSIAIRYTGIPLPELPETMVAVLQQAMNEACVYWREKFGPEHFRIGAYSKYGGREDGVYTTRYTSRKPRQVRAPLRSERPHKDYDGTWVQPGTLQRAFLNGVMKLVTRGAKISDLNVTATFPELPRYTYITKTAVYRRVNEGLFGQKSKTVKTWIPLPKKWLELTITTDAEMEDIAAFVSKRVDELLNEADKGNTPQPKAA